MSSLQIPYLSSSSSSSSQKRVHDYARTNLPKLQRVRISLPNNRTSSAKLVHAFNGSIPTIVPAQKDEIATSQTLQLDSWNPNISKSIKIHKSIGDQRNDWNSLLLNSINTIMVRFNTATYNTILKVTSIFLLIAAKRNVTRLFMKLQTVANPTDEEVNNAIKTSKFEPRTNDHKMKVLKSKRETNNGWSPELEIQMREILEVVKKKDIEVYERRKNLALKITRTLAIIGPLLTVIAAIGSALERRGSSWAGLMAVMAGSLADFFKPLEGMVFEICKNCDGFLHDKIEETLEEKDCEKRENGELFEMKVARKLGRSVSQLRQLALRFSAYDSERIGMDELGSILV